MTRLCKCTGKKTSILRNFFAATNKALHQFNSKLERDLWIYQNRNKCRVEKVPAKVARAFMATPGRQSPVISHPTL